MDSLRFRLTALYASVFGILLTGVGAVVLIIHERDLREQFDARLKDRAAMIVDVITLPPDFRSQRRALRLQRPRFNPFRFPGYYFQLRSEDGDLIEQSVSLDERELPFSEVAAAARERSVPVFETIDEPAFLEDSPLRLLTLYRHVDRSPPFYLQMAVSSEALVYPIQRLRRILYVACPAALVMAAVAAWFLAGRALAPLARVAQAADRLNTEQLALRVEASGKDEVARVVASINAMLDRLAVGFRSHERFIADAAHELKTPLAVVLGQAQVLLQQPRTEAEYARFVSDVQDEVRALGQTVDAMLTLARAEAGVPIRDLSTVSINEAVMDAVERCHALAEERDVRLVPTLVMPTQERPEPLITGDATLLRLMVANLVRNAVHSSPPHEAVDVQVALDGADAVISVRDRGPGIPAAFHDRVFDRFFRVPGKPAPVKGTGLGLAIVRGVARLHGGAVAVADAPDGGCMFTVRIPHGAGAAFSLPDAADPPRAATATD